MMKVGKPYRESKDENAENIKSKSNEYNDAEWQTQIQLIFY